MTNGLMYNQPALDAFNADLNSNFGNSSEGTVSQVMTTEVQITAAQIVATTAGNLAHANGVTLVADPATGYFIEFISATLSYTYATAAYATGDNLKICINGGTTALTGVASGANTLQATSDKIVQFNPLTVAATSITKEKGLSLVAGTAFTVNTNAAGTVKVQISYRIHKI